MGEQARHDIDRWLTLVRGARANRLAVEYAALKVHIAPSDAWHQRRATDGPSAGACIETDQDEARDVT